MEYIVLLTLLVGLTVSIIRTPVWGFVYVYLVSLLLMPTAYQLKIRQLPELTFDRAAVLGVAAVAFLLEPFHWRFTVMDLIVASLVAGAVTAEAVNNGWTPAQSLLFFLLCSTVMPYVLAKHFLSNPKHAARFGKLLVLALTLVAILAVLEFRLGLNVFRIGWGSFFPGQADEHVFVQYRWGYGRIAGPFGHAILCGVAFGAALPIQAWLRESGQWKGLWAKYSWVVTVALVAGLFMTLSRGPWLAAAIGLAVASVPRMLQHWLAALRWAVILVASFAVVYSIGLRYSSLRPVSTLAEEQLSVTYRANLYDRYEPVVRAQPLLGYGTITWPKFSDMRSVDNGYLQLALSYGMAGLVPFVLLILLSVSRLLYWGRRHADRALDWALLGALACYATNAFSVYVGNQLWPLLFLIAGWAEAVVVSAQDAREPAVAPIPRHWAPVF